VNIAVADDAKQRIRHHASRTFTPGVLGGIGGFGALFRARPQKVEGARAGLSSATALAPSSKVAMAVGNHSPSAATSSITASTTFSRPGARAAFFPRLSSPWVNRTDVVEQLVEGMSPLLPQSRLRLIGGETAEIAGASILPVNTDLAGFIVGARRTQKNF